MNSRHYKSILDRFKKENQTIKIVIFMLLLVIVYQSHLIVSKSSSERIIFLPPKVISKEISITGDKLSKEYLEEIASFITYNLFNTTTELANNNALNILALVDSRAYYQTKKKLQEQYDYIKLNNISRTFFINKINLSNNHIQVEGILKSFIGNKVASHEKSLLDIDYRIDNGRFYITDLNANYEEKNK
ncbi:type IV conjugative transfer system protein TraE [Campylobacter sp. RM12651]|uniref:type IV conjugative transfer system protein TraE n=1 Tax=Campylobacter sp. RM12651 TaxID=1660079 RepID=UPI001EFA3781|nr:type IV conjugative transfer system protein TraE [Campylobacter sp. RM12651]ULO03838.1 F-type type IV conjugative transfer system protein TraE [Campylobacter sp. RM12651]